MTLRGLIVSLVIGSAVCSLLLAVDAVLSKDTLELAAAGVFAFYFFTGTIGIISSVRQDAAMKGRK